MTVYFAKFRLFIRIGVSKYDSLYVFLLSGDITDSYPPFNTVAPVETEEEDEEEEEEEEEEG